MPKKLINPPSLAAPNGFNHGILVSGGQMLFLAGQTASDASGKIVAPGDYVAQCEQVVPNHRVWVEAGGEKMADFVKLNIFGGNRRAYAAQPKALGKFPRRYFGEYYPAIALFEVSDLFQDEALIELEGFAVIEPK